MDTLQALLVGTYSVLVSTKELYVERKFNVSQHDGNATLYDDTTPLIAVGIDGVTWYVNPSILEDEGDLIVTETVERLAFRLKLDDDQTAALATLRQLIIDQLINKDTKTIGDVIPKTVSTFEQALTGKVHKAPYEDEPFIEGYDIVSNSKGEVVYLVHQSAAIALTVLAYGICPTRVLGKSVYIVSLNGEVYMKTFDGKGTSFADAQSLFTVSENGLTIHHDHGESITYGDADKLIMAYELFDMAKHELTKNAYNKLMALVK